MGPCPKSNTLFVCDIVVWPCPKSKTLLRALFKAKDTACLWSCCEAWSIVKDTEHQTATAREVSLLNALWNHGRKTNNKTFLCFNVLVSLCYQQAGILSKWIPRYISYMNVIAGIVLLASLMLRLHQNACAFSDYWETRCLGTMHSDTLFQLFFPLILLPPGCPLLPCVRVWAGGLPVWVPVWAHFGSDLPGP